MAQCVCDMLMNMSCCTCPTFSFEIYVFGAGPYGPLCFGRAVVEPSPRTKAKLKQRINPLSYNARTHERMLRNNDKYPLAPIPRQPRANPTPTPRRNPFRHLGFRWGLHTRDEKRLRATAQRAGPLSHRDAFPPTAHQGACTPWT